MAHYIHTKPHSKEHTYMITYQADDKEPNTALTNY